MCINAGRTSGDIVWGTSLNWYSGYPGNCRVRQREWWHLEVWRTKLGTQLSHFWVVQHASPLFWASGSLSINIIRVMHCWSLNEIVNIALVETPVGFCFIVSLYKRLKACFPLTNRKVKWVGQGVSTLVGAGAMTLFLLSTYCSSWV